MGQILRQKNHQQHNKPTTNIDTQPSAQHDPQLRPNCTTCMATLATDSTTHNNVDILPVNRHHLLRYNVLLRRHHHHKQFPSTPHLILLQHHNKPITRIDAAPSTLHQLLV